MTEEKIMKTTRVGRFLAVTIVAGLLATPFAIGQKEEQAEVLMQAAHQKQLVEGQLEEAIQIYKRIVQEHPGNRVVAAKALLEMGQCYEKLGNTEHAPRRSVPYTLKRPQQPTNIAPLSDHDNWRLSYCDVGCVRISQRLRQVDP